MKHRGAFTVFATAFAVVLIGGLALAQVGVLRPADAEPTDPPTIAAAAQQSADSIESATAATSETSAVAAVAAPGTGSPTEDGTKTGLDDETTEPGDKPGTGDDEGTIDDKKVDDGKGDDDKGGGDDDNGDGDDPDDTTPPRIEILHPEDGQVFHEKTITFEGKTEPGAKVTAGRYEADVNEDGHWKIRLVLSEGRNLARFTATDAAGNSADATVTVVYEPKDEKPPSVEFSAHQKYGSSSARPPYDLFWGTATPGAKIYIESDFGSKQVTANSKGGWEAKVYFPEAPIGKAFRVVVESSDGGRKVFEFVAKGDDGVKRDFTANQKYGSCGEDIPYDVFYGKADAGERIWVESPYGSGVTEANKDGHWEVKVKFPKAPPGKVFEVVVEAEHGGRKVFTFVNTGGEGH